MASTKSKENICQYTCFKFYKQTCNLSQRRICGILEPALTNDTTIDETEAHHTNSIALQKVMAEQVKPDVFDPPCHKLTTNIQNKLDTLLKEYESQFAKDETSIGTTPLTSMMIDT